MKNDDPEVGPRQQGPPTQRPVISNGRPANNNGHDTNEQSTLSNELATEVKREPTASLRKIEANRRNSRKSTGPRTAIGKKRVSTNAIRHGFFAKVLLVPHRDGKEDRAEYDALHLRVSEHYQPVGWLEESRVEEIAISSWRLRRSLRYESGIVAKALADHNHQRQQSKKDDLAEPECTLSSDPEIAALTDHLFLPQKEELEGLLRYESMFRRQLNHAIGELERLQTRRKEGSTLLNVGTIAKQSQEVL